jgi:hypothetical protein
MASKKKAVVLTGLLLLIGGATLSACGSSGSSGTPDGPHMVYFYAQW